MFFTKGFLRLGPFESRCITNRFFRKNTPRIMKKIEQNELLDKLVSNPVVKSTQDVNHLRHTILISSDVFTPENVDRSLIVHLTKNEQYNIALNYMNFLDNETKKNLYIFLTNQQFLIYFHKRYTNGSLSTSEQELIVQLFHEFKDKMKVLDSNSLEKMILGLSVTPEWTMCLNLFHDLKKLDNPSSMCYSAIIAAAFLNEDHNTAWTFLNELLAKQRVPNDIIFKAYFEKLGRMSNKKEKLSHLCNLFNTCNENNFILTENSISDFSKLLNKTGLQYKITTINEKGYCRNCKKKLELQEISDIEFETLRKKFFESVVMGKNIFAKSTPAELSEFQNFLRTLKNCDVVIDGLNVAYVAGTKHSPAVQSTLLANVVSHFIERNKKVVVLGRKHMESWPKKQWNYIKSNSQLFLTHDISQDDPYLLYCALHCGQNTSLVSRDLMRSHLFALKSLQDKIMFSRWLEQRQLQLIHIRNDGTVIFKYPRAYTRIAQQNGESWHIPFNMNPTETRENIQVLERWLCIGIS